MRDKGVFLSGPFCILYIRSVPFAQSGFFTRQTVEYMGQANLLDKSASEWVRGPYTRQLIE